MILRLYAILFGVATLAAGVLVFGESSLLSPAPISEIHAELELECRACHTPFQGASLGCESCHGAMADSNAHHSEGVGCADCHSEHRGIEHSLLAEAREDCSTCHAHPSIAEVPAHAVGGTMTRFVDPASSQRAEAEAFTTFSHAMHFEEAEITDDPGCRTCHFVGETAEATRGGEQLVRWSGCSECHDDWQAAGFEKARGRGMVTLELERFERVAFSHSDEHLEAGCEDCHGGIRQAEEIGDTASTTSTAANLASCFGCHVHQPEGASWAVTAESVADSDYAVGSNADCLGCHELHGAGVEADFASAPDSEPRELGWDVWARAGGLSLTPWLALFLGLGCTGWVVALRRLPETGRGDLGANPDVAPQRVAEVPVLSPFFETSVPSLYIIGELAGVPLVNRAMKSGFDVIDFISNRLGKGGSDSTRDDTVEPEDKELDLLIAGSGPAGLGAATRAQSLGLEYVVCEKSTAAATIRDYPRAKIIQAAPVDIPDYGSFFQEDDESKDALVRRWEDIITRTGVLMREREEVTLIEADADGGFVVEVQNGAKQYRTKNVVLAIGMRGTPRRLRVDGETSDRVAYNLIDAAEYTDQDVLVVGGGNAAIEAALALSQPELLNRVHLAIRGPVIKGITPQNSSDIDAAAAEGQLEIIPSASMLEIRPETAVLKTPDGEKEIPNQMTFALIGAELPLGFLRKIGVKLAKKGGG
jgi:thioredoxin reductase (NADPH)